MRRSAPLPVLASLLLTAAIAHAAGSSADVVIEIDAARPGITISDQLWGIFFEEINFAGDGGIYAELVRQRAFEGDKPLEGWSLVKNQAEGEMQVDPTARLNDVRTQSLKVTVKSIGDGGTLDVVNSGYWGVPVKQGDRYTFSLFAKGDAQTAGTRLHISLRDKTLQKVYAEAVLNALGPDWRRLDCTLTPDATDMDGRLVISGGTPGTFWLDVVSLFPPTWKDQPNGLRPDLVKLLADLQPSFFRFPGGCFAEGRTLADTFLFKETVGPIEQRKGRHNLWGYLSSDGLGYYEYLRLSEDLGADPIYCINPGGNNGCKEVIKFEDLGPWLQTAVDAVEFAIGPADSNWGAKRAAMGHPEPFRFKTFYLQIGNETEFRYDDYLQRFKAYRARVKGAFPGENVKVIGDSWGLKHRQSVDTFAIDFHQYSSWQRAIASRDKYDAAPRGKPYIFEGEYATRSGSGIQQALSEAVYMMGLEENGDEVVMAAYAPLFGHVNGCQWKPDLIYFDNHRSMGTISYYVQEMFSTHRGDRLLPLAIEAKPEPTDPPEDEKMAGSIGVGTWSTQAEYKDVRVVVDGKAVYQSDFSEAASLKQWKTKGGSWEIRDGVLRQTSLATDCRAWLADGRFSKYELRMKARKTAGDEGFLIMFHVEGANNFVWANLGGWGNTRHAFERCRDGAKAGGQGQQGAIETGRWYDVSIKVDGSRAECSLDGKRLMEVDLGNLAADRDPVEKVYASAVTDQSAGEVLLRVVNISARPKRARLSIAGLVGVEKKATAITLAAENLEAEQQLDQPTRYQPVTTVFDVTGAEFDYEFKPCSLTILRIKSVSPLPTESAVQQEGEAGPETTGLVPVQPVQDDWYLLTSFHEDHGLLLSVSPDGLKWQAVNDDKSVLEPTIPTVFRDPSIARDASGVYHMVWTVAWACNGNGAIGYSSSRDLIHWSTQRAIPVMQDEPGTEMVWAPELFWDAGKKQWMIHWSSSVTGKFPETLNLFDGHSNGRIYYTMTKDFQTFTPSKLLFNADCLAIDSHVYRAEGDRYCVFFKADRRESPKRGIMMATGPAPSGPYTLDPKMITPSDESWAEGPCGLRVGAKHRLYYASPKTGFAAFESEDLKSWNPVHDKMVPPGGYRHGTVIRISPQEAMRLLDHDYAG